MRSASLPGHIAIKAIGVDRKSLFVETAQVDIEKIQRIIEEGELDITFNREKRTFSTRTGKKLVVLSGSSESGRTLWTVPLHHLSDDDTDLVISFIDTVSIENAFENGEEEFGSLTPGQAPALLLQLNLSMVQLLEQEQQPQLLAALDAALDVNVDVTVNFDITRLLRLQHIILRMSTEELVEFVTKDTSKEGQQKVLRVLHFVLSGKIKRLKSELDWKSARKIAWSLIHKRGPAAA